MWSVGEHLAGFDSVEVVDLKGALGNEAREYLDGSRATKRVRVSSETAARIAALLCDLPPAEQMRCHIPPYGLVFYKGQIVLCRISICWQCNNITGTAGDASVWYEFDARAKPARELLKLCKQAMTQAS